MNELRPQKFDDIVGQNEIKQILKITINSAKERKDVVPHIILSATTPGVGKTTFAECIANEIGANIHFANGAALRSIKNLAPHILKIEYGDILFIDEIHRLTKITEEFLHTVMEDFFCIFGSNDDVVKLNIPKFTLIGATTEFGSLSKPFRDRFKLPLTFSCYSESDLAKLASFNASKLKIEIEPEAAIDIAKRSRNTPRILNRLLEWCRDYSLSKPDKKITLKNVEEAMKILKIDSSGFTLDDRKAIILLKGAKMPLALNTISSILKIDEKTIKDEIEPFLLSKGLIGKCTKGRYYCGKE